MASLEVDLDVTFNTETQLTINSTARSSGTASAYTIPISLISGVNSLHLMKFISPAALPVGTKSLFIRCPQLGSAKYQIPGFGQTDIMFVIPVLRIPYSAQTQNDNRVSFPKGYRPEINSLTFEFYGDNGALVTSMTEHTMCFYIRSYS
jgi:hypothetical protein